MLSVCAASRAEIRLKAERRFIQKPHCHFALIDGYRHDVKSGHKLMKSSRERKSFLPIVHCCSREAAKSGELVKMSVSLKSVPDEGPHVLSGESMLDLLQMSVVKSETDDSSGTDICLFLCGVGGSKSVRWVFRENECERP